MLKERKKIIRAVCGNYMAAKTKQPLPTKTANNKSMTEKPILYYDYLLETNDISLQNRK